MTATNMFSNFGGKWDSPPYHLLQSYLSTVSQKRDAFF